jgi:hypothetical protein
MGISYNDGDLGSGPRVDWDDALAVPSFYGREIDKGVVCVNILRIL